MYSRGNTEHEELHSPTHPSPPARFRLCGPAEGRYKPEILVAGSTTIKFPRDSHATQVKAFGRSVLQIQFICFMVLPSELNCPVDVLNSLGYI